MPGGSTVLHIEGIRRAAVLKFEDVAEAGHGREATFTCARARALPPWLEP